MFLIFCFAFSVIIGGWLDRYERKGRRRLRKRRFEEAALYFAEVMSTMKIMPGQKNGGFGFGLLPERCRTEISRSSKGKMKNNIEEKNHVFNFIFMCYISNSTRFN